MTHIGPHPEGVNTPPSPNDLADEAYVIWRDSFYDPDRIATFRDSERLRFRRVVDHILARDTTALEMSRKAEQEQRRAESAEAEVERLRSRLAKVRRVFDLQCPPLLPSKYDSQGAWMAHTWWDRVLGAVLREADGCEWCGRADGHENGCRLGLGPDEEFTPCWRGECQRGCYYPEVCSEQPGCAHHWLDRPESDTRECLICGTEVSG